MWATCSSYALELELALFTSNTFSCIFLLLLEKVPVPASLSEWKKGASPKGAATGRFPLLSVH